MTAFFGKVNAGTPTERGIAVVADTLSSCGITADGFNNATITTVDISNNISAIKFHSDFRMGELVSSKVYTYTFPSASTMGTVTRVIDYAPGVTSGIVTPLVQSASGWTFEYSLVNSSIGTRVLQFYINSSGYLVCRDIMIPKTEANGGGNTLPSITTSFIVHYIKI